MKKNYSLTLIICLILVSINTIIWSVTNIFSIQMPDLAIRLMGILNLILIPISSYTLVKMRNKNK